MKDFVISMFLLFLIFGGFYLYNNTTIIRQKQPNVEKLLETEQEIGHRIELLLTVQSILLCESSGKHENVWGDKNYKYPAYGIAQIQERTFYWLSDKAGFKNMKWKNKNDQIKLLMWAVENDYGELWTCYKEWK